MKRCNKALCRTLIKDTERYCPQHKNSSARAYNRYTRKTPQNKRYTDFYWSPEWRNLRKTKIQLNPLCENCLRNNEYSKGQVVHHIVEIKDIMNGGWEKRADLDNLETLCHACHNRHHKGE